MDTTRPNDRRGATGERGIALIMALMALIILTALGLTLAATTSTELQVAANYRWSQQALYNAEAGLEVAKVMLATGTAWDNLPTPTRAPWDPSVPPTAPAVVPGYAGGRNNEMWACDSRGGGMGYGFILSGLVDQSQYGGQPLNGSFTVWARWPLDYSLPDGRLQEDADNALVIVSEGVAPLAVGGAVARSGQLLEATFYRQEPGDKRCLARNEPAPGGAGTNPCHALTVDGAPTGIPLPQNP